MTVPCHYLGAPCSRHRQYARADYPPALYLPQALGAYPACSLGRFVVEGATMDFLMNFNLPSGFIPSRTYLSVNSATTRVGQLERYQKNFNITEQTLFK